MTSKRKKKRSPFIQHNQKPHDHINNLYSIGKAELTEYRSAFQLELKHARVQKSKRHIMDYNIKIKHLLKHNGIDVDLIASSSASDNLPCVKGAIHLCKDMKTGAILLTGIPSSVWHFEGPIILIDGIILFIDKSIASEMHIS